MEKIQVNYLKICKHQEKKKADHVKALFPRKKLALAHVKNNE